MSSTRFSGVLIWSKFPRSFLFVWVAMLFWGGSLSGWIFQVKTSQDGLTLRNQRERDAKWWQPLQWPNKKRGAWNSSPNNSKPSSPCIGKWIKYGHTTAFTKLPSCVKFGAETQWTIFVYIYILVRDSFGLCLTRLLSARTKQSATYPKKETFQRISLHIIVPCYWGGICDDGKNSRGNPLNELKN